MGSGEDYGYSLTGYTRTVGNEWGTNTTGHTWIDTAYTWPVTWTVTSPVYYYQIFCPNCKKASWVELNKTVTCDCGKTIKAVEEKVDYEVEIIQRG